MQHCVPTPGLLCSKAKLELDWIFNPITGLLLDYYWIGFGENFAF